MSVAFIIAFAPLAYVNLDADGPTVFDWLLALSGLAALFTWGSICLAHIRFRTAWARQGHTLDEIPFRALGGVYGSYLGLGLNILCLIAQVKPFCFPRPPHPLASLLSTCLLTFCHVQLYVAICPVGGGFNDAEGFFKSYLALPVVIVFWIGGFVWKRTGWLRTDQIDLDTGRRELDWDAINEDRARIAAMPGWKRVLNKLFV